MDWGVVAFCIVVTAVFASMFVLGYQYGRHSADWRCLIDAAEHGAILAEEDARRRASHLYWARVRKRLRDAGYGGSGTI